MLIFSLIKKEDSLGLKSGKFIGGIILSFGIFSILMSFIFVLGFGAWKDYDLLYVNKHNSKHRIVEQIFDEGALGYGGTRTIETKPILFIFKLVIPKDVNNLNEEVWEKKNEHVLFKE